MKAIKEKQKALDALEKWNLEHTDEEIAHCMCDDILLEFLDVIAPEVSAKFREVKERVGFWYA